MPLVIDDDAGPPTRPAASSAWSARTSALRCRMAGVATSASRSSRMRSISAVDEPGRGEQRVSLEVDDQIRIVQRL